MQRLTSVRPADTGIYELSKRPDLDSFQFRDAINTQGGAVFFISIAVVIMAAVGSGAACWLVSIENNPEFANAWAITGGGTIGAVVGVFVLRWLARTGASYEAYMKEALDAIEPGPALAPIENRPRSRVMLNSHDKELLKAFARRYPAKRTLAINEWEGRDSPFVFDWLNSKRQGIERVQTLIIRMGLGKRDGRGGVVTGVELDRRIPDWQNGIFEAETPLPPDGPSTHTQEVDHE